MERSLFAYIWRFSRPEQVVILALVVLAQIFYFLSLTVPKDVINNGIQGNAFKNQHTIPFLVWEFDLSAFLPRSPDARQQLLIAQLQSGLPSRTLLIGIEGADAPARAAASRALAARLRASGLFEQVQNGEREAFAEVVDGNVIALGAVSIQDLNEPVEIRDLAAFRQFDHDVLGRDVLESCRRIGARRSKWLVRQQGRREVDEQLSFQPKTQIPFRNEPSSRDFQLLDATFPCCRLEQRQRRLLSVAPRPPQQSLEPIHAPVHQTEEGLKYAVEGAFLEERPDRRNARPASPCCHSLLNGTHGTPNVTAERCGKVTPG